MKAAKSFLTHRPVAVSMVFLAAVVFGLLSYQGLPVTLMPELSYPTLTVRTEYPGAAPEEVENDISRRIEEQLGVVGGLRRMSSISRAGVSDVVLEFAWDTAMSDAVQETLEKLDLVLLPDSAERPLILRFDPGLDPVLELSLSGEDERFEGEEGLRRLRRLAELQVKRALEPIDGVAAVRVRGGLEEEIHVLLDAQALQRSRLSVQQVIDRLGQENINVAGGTLKEGRTEYMVRTVNEYVNLDQIRATVVATVEGREVRVGDLAEVRRSHRDREILTRTDGGESVQLDVYKEADANMVALADRVRERVGELDLERERARARGETVERPRNLLQRLTGGSGGSGGGRSPSLGGATLSTDLYRSEGAVLTVVSDRSEFIEGSIAEVRNTAILGGLLAVIVLYLFLRNLVTTLFVAVSIPISLLITFAPLSAASVSLNIMSLGGLALGIGMLVDSSIVVLESIFRCREEGDDLVASAIRGAKEVRSAVIASILTSIAVFLPMVFVEGIAGQAFGDLGLAVVISLLASMAVALAFIPMLASRRGWTLPERGGAAARLRRYAAWEAFRRDAAALLGWARSRNPLIGWPGLVPALAFISVRLVVGSVLELVAKVILILLAGLAFLIVRLIGPVLVKSFTWLSRGPLIVVRRLLEWLSGVYPALLDRSLRFPVAVVVVVAVTLWSSWWLLGRLDSELLPEVRQGEFTIEVSLPVGTPLSETERTLAAVESAILEEERHIDRLLVTYGYDVTNTQRSDEGEHTARFKVLLGPVQATVEDEVVERLRRRFESIPDASSRVSRPVLFSFKTPIEVEVHGEDLDRLQEYGDRVRDLMAAMPELADVETTLKRGAPEVQIVYDRAILNRYDLQTSVVAQMVRNQIEGFEATLYNLRDRRIPIVVRLAEEDRRSTDQLNGLVVNPGGERPIPLHAVADVAVGEGPSEVRRIDGKRVAVIEANLGAASLGGAVERIEEVLANGIEWPADMSFLVGGQSQEWQRSSASLWLALGLSVFLVYVIMAAQFESLLHPLVIMFSIPLAFFGTLVTLYLLDVNLSIVVFLGMIMLAGIVVNNAIVLVDYINRLRARGLPRRRAIVGAGLVRLRPILMTTATTTLGLLPMALGLGQGAEIRTPMALAVIGGLVASTVLTLIVVPTIYEIFERLREALSFSRERIARPATANAEAAGPAGAVAPQVSRP
ncbi:MAG: efflux RND transporter permease subunit [Holophagales bacterium]|nr:efflux RND transporter permease subunit [Holophagales bacterium]MYD21762.1 efflux RND transporter permease subunit [Holophagales bacterium]MYI32041.1 efflux RND transporter permease subunit [Holophagales bacterium]